MKRYGFTACMLTGAMLIIGMGENVLAEEPGSKPGVMERIETTVKKVGKKIEEGFNKTVKKVEDKHIGDKIEKKLKKAATKTGEGFEKAGKKIEQKLGN